MTVFNRKEKTLQCLKNIEEQTIHSNQEVKVDVYLTNDGCTDGTPEAVSEQYPNVCIIEGDGTLFWNRGMYVAWQEAAKSDYDFYLWLNDDTFIYKDTISRLLEKSTTYKDKAILVGNCCAIGDKSTITYGGYELGTNKLNTNTCTDVPCGMINGNIVLIPKHVFDILGFNDYYYRHGSGDNDYGMMALKSGIKTYAIEGICGECNRHEQIAKWCDPQVPVSKRFKYLYSPGGNGANPFEHFHYRRKFYGFIPACITFISNHIHTLCPILYNKIRK